MIADIALPATENTTIYATGYEGKRAEKAKKSNIKAMTALTMSFVSNSLMEIIFKVKSTEWPSGPA